MSKKSFANRVSSRPNKPDAKTLDAFVSGEGNAELSVVPSAPKQATGKMKRLTLDVSEDLHRRVKAQSALQGRNMVEAIREVLEREFPKT